MNIETISTVFLLAILVEGIIEYFVSDTTKIQPWIKYVSATFGITVAVLYKVDILSELGAVSDIPYVGSVITGLIIGRGSNYLNDFISKIRKPKI